MESDYRHRQLSNESAIIGMEKRTVDLRSNIQQLQEIKQKIDKDRVQLIKNNEQLQIQVDVSRS